MMKIIFNASQAVALGLIDDKPTKNGLFYSDQTAAGGYD
jgi:hypothetical protein